MNELIEALNIFAKYTQDNYPTHCEHDTLMILVDPRLVSKEDVTKLDDLGFFVSDDGHFYSFRFGSA
jgi:hypothetical protein